MCIRDRSLSISQVGNHLSLAVGLRPLSMWQLAPKLEPTVLGSEAAAGNISFGWQILLPRVHWQEGGTTTLSCLLVVHDWEHRPCRLNTLQHCSAHAEHMALNSSDMFCASLDVSLVSCVCSISAMLPPKAADHGIFELHCQSPAKSEHGQNTKMNE